jgi:hypothetical protein
MPTVLAAILALIPPTVLVATLARLALAKAPAGASRGR